MQPKNKHLSKRDTINRVKKQPTEWEKILPNQSDEGLIPRIYRTPKTPHTQNLIQNGQRT